MSIELINPNGIFEPDTYSQVAIAKGRRRSTSLGRLHWIQSEIGLVKVTWHLRLSRHT
jgi:hypothetical protein